jgi:peptidoglycan/xylan/chitin deacetylase (PgdA/CDA1 family)
LNQDLFDRLRQKPELWNIFTGDLDPRALKPGMHLLPAVSEYLVSSGLRASYPDGKKFAICLTHDVDEIYPTTAHRVLSGLYCLKNRDLGGFKKYMRSNGSQAPDYINFRQIMEFESLYGAKSTFFFMSTSYDPVRFRYNIEDIEDEIRSIAKAGWEVGLHGGYYSFDDPKAIESEKKRLERALGREVVGYRNHYLNFRIPDTWEILEKCGFKYDSTYGFSDDIGFRSGMCHPYRPYNIKRREWMEIFELPLHIMESAMLDKPRKAWELISRLLDKAEANKGVLTVLWHNSIFSCPYREDWRALYVRLLQYGRQRNAWMTSGEEILGWWIKNGCSSDNG